MKDLAVIIYDYTSNNYNIELNYYFDKNLDIYPELEKKVELFLVSPNHNKYEFNPRFIDKIGIYTENESLSEVLAKINSKYTLLISSQDILSHSLKEIIDNISKYDAEMIFTNVEYQNIKNQKHEKNEAQNRLFELENEKNINNDLWNLNFTGTFIRTDYLKAAENLMVTNAINSRLLYNELLLNLSDFKIYQTNIVIKRDLIYGDLECERFVNQIIREFSLNLEDYYMASDKKIRTNLINQYLNDKKEILYTCSLNNALNTKKYHTMFKYVEKKHINELKNTANHLELIKSKLPINQLKTAVLSRKLHTALQISFKLIPITENKIVLINASRKYDGELKYFTSRMLKKLGDSEVYFNSNQNIKGINRIKKFKSLKYYYHLHTASEVIYFDNVFDNFSKSKNQTVVEIYNSNFNKNYLAFDKTLKMNYLTDDQKQLKMHINSVDEFICPDENTALKISEKLNKETSVRELASRRFLNKHINNAELYQKLIKKHNLLVSKDYLLYPILDVNHHQYIDVKALNHGLKNDEIIIFVALSENYTLCNIEKQAYVLMDTDIDVIEIAIICDGIFDNGNNLIEVFRNANRKIVKSNNDVELYELVHGHL